MTEQFPYFQSFCVRDFLSLFEQHQYSEHGRLNITVESAITCQPLLPVEVARRSGPLTLSMALSRKPTFLSWSLQRITSRRPGRISALLMPMSAPVTGRTMPPNPDTEATCCMVVGKHQRRQGAGGVDGRRKHPQVKRKAIHQIEVGIEDVQEKMQYELKV